MIATLRRRRVAAAVLVVCVLAALFAAGLVRSNPAASSAFRGAPMSTTGAVASAGCATGPALAGGRTTSHSISVGTTRRTYLVHEPDASTTSHPLPLLIAFHGHGRSGSLLEQDSHLSDLPAVVVYPNGTPDLSGRLSWEGAPYSVRGVDDVAFTQALLRTVESSVCVDLDRVFTVGHSNGGEFATLAACRLGTQIAATAVVSGAFYDRTTVCDHPLALFELHGTADRIIPYLGGRVPGGRVPSVPQLMADQATINGCRTTPATRRLSTDVTQVTYDGCTRPLEQLRVARDHHQWPGRTVAGLPASALVWRFLSTQSRGH